MLYKRDGKILKHLIFYSNNNKHTGNSIFNHIVVSRKRMEECNDTNMYL